MCVASVRVYQYLCDDMMTESLVVIDVNCVLCVKHLARDTGKEFGDPVEMSGCFTVPRQFLSYLLSSSQQSSVEL